MAWLFDVLSETAMALRGFPVSQFVGERLRTHNATFVPNTAIHYYHSQEPNDNNTAGSLFGYGDGTANGVFGVEFRARTSDDRLRFSVRQGNGAGVVEGAVDCDCGPFMPHYGSTFMVAVTTTGNAAAGATVTYAVRVYRDGVLIGVASNTNSARTPTRPTLFNYTTDGFLIASTTFNNARGIHAHWLVGRNLSDAEIDALALLPWVGPHANHAADILYAPGVYTTEATTSALGVRPEVVAAANTICTIDVGAASDSTLLRAASGRSPATITGRIRWVDPFEETGVRAPAPGVGLVSMPAGYTVGVPFLGRSAHLRVLHAGWITGEPTERQIVALVANSRVSLPDTVRMAPRDSAYAVSNRSWSGNYIDYDGCVELPIRGRHNFQPPLNTTNGGAWGFDCQADAPLTTGTACADLADTTAARFGSGSRVAGPGSPSYHGPGDPILVPASASYRLLAGPEEGLRASDEIQVSLTILNTPNSSQITVRREAAQHTQAGADVLSAANESGMPTLGTAMSAASFTGYNSSTNTFSGVSTIADAQVGDMLEVCDASGNRLAEIELAVITSVSAGTIVVDGKFKIGSTVAASPANYRLKWCAPAIHKITVTHAASVTNANWRGLKVTSGASGGGLVVMSFGVSNRSRPGPELMPYGWSGKGWRDQYQQMSHVVSARDGKTMAQRFFESTPPDLVLFSVADQGNPSGEGILTAAQTYVDYILLGAPNAEIVMAGDCAHSVLETVVGLSDAATNYNNHHAAMQRLALARGYTYLTLIGDTSRDRIGSVHAQYARGMLVDGTAHPYRGVWRGWMRQVGQLLNPAYARAKRTNRARVRRG